MRGDRLNGSRRAGQLRARSRFGTALAVLTTGLRPGTRTARAVSMLFYPPLSALAALALLAAVSGPGAAWYLVLALLVAMLPPLVWLVRGLRRGRISDLDVSHREQRTGLYLIAIAASAMAVILLVGLGAPPALTAALASALCGMLVAIPVQWVMKPSVHVGVLTLVAANLAPRFPLAALGFGLATALVAWARWHLERHTAFEVVAGAVLGVVGVLVVWSFGVG